MRALKRCWAIVGRLGDRFGFAPQAPPSRGSENAFFENAFFEDAFFENAFFENAFS